MSCFIRGKKLRIDNKISACRAHRCKSSSRKSYKARWKENHREQYLEAKRQWTRRNPQYFKTWRNHNETRRIAHALRTRLRRVVKYGSSIKNLGCSISELLIHLENKFSDGMTWSNYGKWHIDHIKPLSSFNLSDPNQLAIACNYKNLQLLWAEENIRKNDRLDYYPTSA